MADLRLARLPERTPVKITIAVSPDLNQVLSDYAEVYREGYGQAEPVQELIPAAGRIFANARAVPPGLLARSPKRTVRTGLHKSRPIYLLPISIG